jgi:BirA family biotin operon repressor/biotin-[acetyl-CoA-carboxylase] ligase
MWLFAWEQHAGKGRQGRAWSSPPGLGVYATLSLGRVGWPQLAVLPLLVAASLCTTANRWIGGRCRLKWPNDLMVDGLKLGGVLIESVSRGVDAAAAIIGFGINHGQSGGDLLLGYATSLRLQGGSIPPLGEAAATLALDLEAALRDSPESAIERYVALSAHRVGDPVRCRSAGETVEGSFAGFDGRGFLRLDTARGERLMAAGEVVEW